MSMHIEQIDRNIYCVYSQCMDNQKKTVSFRLSGIARVLLGRLSEKKGINQTAIIEMLIREMAERENVSVAKGNE